MTNAKKLTAGALLLLATAALAKDAKDIYLEKCSICHGADGAGKTAKGRKLKAKDVRDSALKVTAAEMMMIVEHGKGSSMYAYGKELSKDQIKEIVEHYRGLAK